MYKGGLFKRNARQISTVIVHGIRQKQHFEVFFNGEEERRRWTKKNLHIVMCMPSCVGIRNSGSVVETWISIREIRKKYETKNLPDE